MSIRPVYVVDGARTPFLKSRNRPGPFAASDLAVQAGEGLCAIHEAGVIHRDLKPANIMRDRQGVVRLMDFGIARGSEGLSLTRPGDVLGSPQYMSPGRGRIAATLRQSFMVRSRGSAPATHGSDADRSHG